MLFGAPAAQSTEFETTTVVHTLSEIDPAFPEDYFTFTPPPGTDGVRGRHRTLAPH